MMLEPLWGFAGWGRVALDKMERAGKQERRIAKMERAPESRRGASPRWNAPDVGLQATNLKAKAGFRAAEPAVR